MDSEIAHYKISVHLFGAVYALSSSNYTSRKAATATASSRNCYKNDATAAIPKTFYVDDLL